MNKLEAINEIKKLDTTFKSITGRWLPFHGVLDIFNQINEPKKVKIPQFVAEWIGKCRSKINNLKYAITEAPEDVSDWMSCNRKGNMDKFARAWLDGYEVEQDKRCTVKIKQTDQYLDTRYIGDGYIFVDTKYPPVFTKQELEQAGFGGVFGNDMFEVEEVK